MLTECVDVKCHGEIWMNGDRPHTGSEHSLALKALMQACPCLVVSCHTDKPYLNPPEGPNARISCNLTLFWEKTALLLMIWFVCYDKCMQHYKHAYHALRESSFFWLCTWGVYVTLLIFWLCPFSCSHGDDLIVTPFAQVSDTGSSSGWILGYISSRPFCTVQVNMKLFYNPFCFHNIHTTQDMRRKTL